MGFVYIMFGPPMYVDGALDRMFGATHTAM